MGKVRVQDGRRNNKGNPNPNIAEIGKASQFKAGVSMNWRYPIAMQLYNQFIEEEIEVIRGTGENVHKEKLQRFRVWLEEAQRQYFAGDGQMGRWLMDFSGGSKIIFKQMELELLALQVNKTDRLTQLLEENALTDRQPPKDYTPYEETNDELLKKKSKAKSEKKK